MASRERKLIVERVREEGRTAFLNGKHHQTNPYDRCSSNHGQWLRGYHEAYEDYTAAKASEAAAVDAP